MAVLTFSFVMTLVSFFWWMLIVFTAHFWRRIVDVETRLSVRLGIPAGLAAWLQKRETGTTLKVIVLALTLTSALCVMEAARLIR